MPRHYDNEAIAALHEAAGRPDLARISRMDEQQLRDIVLFLIGADPRLYAAAVKCSEGLTRAAAEQAVSQ